MTAQVPVLGCRPGTAERFDCCSNTVKQPAVAENASLPFWPGSKRANLLDMVEQLDIVNLGEPLLVDAVGAAAAPQKDAYDREARVAIS